MNNAIEIVSQEIEWHKNNLGVSDQPEDWENGFICGMEHLLYLFMLVQEKELCNVK